MSFQKPIKVAFMLGNYISPQSSHTYGINKERMTTWRKGKNNIKNNIKKE